MRSFIVLISIMNFSFSVAQTNTETEIQSVIQNMFQDVFSGHSTASIDKYFANDIILFEDGIIYNRDSIQEMANVINERFDAETANGHKLERKNNFDFLNTTFEENNGFVIYKNQAAFLYDGTTIAKVEWLESAKLERFEGVWKITFLHSTTIKNNEKIESK